VARVYSPSSEGVPAAVRAEARINRTLRELGARGVQLTWRRLKVSALTDTQKIWNDTAQQAPAPAGPLRHQESAEGFFASQPRGYGPVRVSYVVCDTCGESGPLSTEQEHGAIGEGWQHEHDRATGHTDFDVWTLSRHQARTALV
jgi:hypothetical protein